MANGDALLLIAKPFCIFIGELNNFKTFFKRGKRTQDMVNGAFIAPLSMALCIVRYCTFTRSHTHSHTDGGVQDINLLTGSN